MKKCSYCGAEYPDDAVRCAIDQTPFEEVSPEAARVRLPTFAIFSEHKIPVSLAVLSYVFFLPAAGCFAFIGFMILMLVISGGFPVSGEVVSKCIIGLFIGIFFLCLSRGLRRCSRGWRRCVLVFVWCGFISTTFIIGKYLLTHKLPAHETATEFWLVCALTFAWQAWQYRVLTRPDIRDLFYA
jgi:hypothetical protein